MPTTTNETVHSFVAMITPKKNDRNGNPRSKMKIYWINDNNPDEGAWPLIRVVDTFDYGYQSETQAAVSALITAGVLTKEDITDGKGVECWDGYSLRANCNIWIQEIRADK